MQAVSERPQITSLFKKSVLAWRESYRATKAATQQMTGEETPAETPKTVLLKIRRARRSKARN